MKKLYLLLFPLLLVIEVYSQETVFPNEGTTMTLGTGYNSLTGRDLDRCIIGETITTLAGGHGSETFVTFEEIKTRSQLNRILGLNASASLGIGGFSGSSKVSFANNYEFNSSTYYLAIRIIVRNQSEVLKQFKLTDEAKALLSSNKELFLQVCGDAFIAARVTGGEFLAIVKLETNNSSEKNTLSASFKAKFTSFSGSGGGSSEITQIFEKHNGTIDVVRRGGNSALPQFWEPASLKNYSAQFPTEVSSKDGAPIVYSITTKPYSELLDAVNHEIISLTNSRVVLEDLAKTHTKAVALHDNIGYIVSHPNEFINPDMNELLAFDTEIVAIINKIREHASICEQFPADPLKCKVLPAEILQLPIVNLPERINGTFKLLRSTACGIERYEMRKVPKTCRTAANGEEVVETRKIDYERMVHEQVKWKHRQDLNVLAKKLIDKEYPGTSGQPKSKPNPVSGFDNSWKVIKYEYVGDNGRRTVGGLQGDETIHRMQFRVTLSKYQYKLAPHIDCGFSEVTDYEKPIFKECRHISHGYQE